MANPFEYIVFEPDQVLTNDHLNETFNYLDQQDRWTRNKLIGIGIVCGLDIVLNTGIIQVNKGCGITSQGYLITLDTMQYTYYIPYAAVDMPLDLPFTYTGNLPFYKPFCAGKNVWQLLTDDDFNALESDKQATAVTISSATSFLTDYAMVLFLEAAETELKNCNMLDCNNSGSTMVFTVRPLLVAISDLPGTLARVSIPLLDLRLLKPNQLSLKRYNVPYADLNNSNDVLNAFASLVDDATLTAVANAYTSCFQQYGNMVKATTNPFANLLVNLQSARSSIQSSNPVFIQYLYDFVDDLIKAYNEFNTQASAIMGTCCPDENLFPLHLVLGSASQATNAFTKDSYRNYFIYSALFSKMGEDVADAALLFNRMVIMVNYFTVQTQALQTQATITITPSKFEYALLSERAIPYYYKINVNGSELYKYWNYYKTVNNNAARNLSYNSSLYSSDPTVTQPLLYDIECFNFFRVEGHIGQNYNTVLTNILNQQSQYNLPFDVVAVSADQLQPNASLPQCSMNDLDTDYQLLLSEAACKIHTVFCFITKLPYVVAANTTAQNTGSFTTARSYLYEIPQTANLNYSAFKLEPATINIAASQTLTPTYQKGNFMRTYCPAVASTIGSAYLAALDSTGVFTNPVQIDSSNSLTTVYYYLFAFVDAVEELMFALQTNTLAEIDINGFNTIYQTYLADTLYAMGILMELTENIASNNTTAANAQYVTLAEDTELDLLVDELGLLTSLCLEERLQVLVTTYTNRLTQYEQQLNFLNYFKNHPGLEHKAGVPKGGTLVLVYHTGTERVITDTATTAATAAATTTATPQATNQILIKQSTDVSAAQVNIAATTADSLSTATTADTTSALDPSTFNLISSYVNSATDITAATRQTILGILQNVPTRRPPGYSIPNGAVIADFYIPYLCCSDCPPVAYVLTNTVTPVKPTITMGTTFCDNDTTAEPITVSAPGGTFNTVAGLDPVKLTFTPATAKAGVYKITYTLNGVASNPVTVTVLATPVSTFSFKASFSTVNSVNILTAVFTPDASGIGYTYSWSFGTGFSETASSLQSPQLTVQVDPNGGQTQTFATLTVSNGQCALASVTQTLYISPNGLSETPIGSGSILSGIKNIFTKKG
jgi:predicted nucleic acid-binding protein